MLVTTRIACANFVFGANIEMASDTRNSARTISYTIETTNADASSRMIDTRGSHVVVIGGGFSGVAAATSLRAGGFEVTILERHAMLGGRARSETRDGVVIDTGAQLIASTFTHATRMLAQARLEPTIARDVFVRDGARLPLQFGSIASMMRFAGLGATDKLRLGTKLLPLLARHRGALRADAPGGLEDLDNLSAREFVEKTVSTRAADVLVEPPLNTFYGARGRETSLAFFLTLGRYGSDAKLLASRAGWSAALAAAASDVRVEYEVVVEHLQMTSDAVIARDAAGRTWRADAAVIATGPRSAGELLGTTGGDATELRQWLTSITTRPTWTVMVALNRAVNGEAFGVLADPTEAGMVSACALPALRWPEHGPSKGVVLAWPTPHAVEQLRDRSPTELVSSMMPEIERLVPEVRGAIERARVFRFAEGTPLVAPGFIAHRAEGRRLADALPAPIALAGDYLTMPILEGAVISGERAAERIVRYLGRS